MAIWFFSAATDLVVSTDFPFGQRDTFAADPFIWVETKAVNLDARIQTFPVPPGSGGRPPEIHLTIGLFTILKLFRLVHLNVQSTGFCTPEVCRECNDINPCDYFAELDFPMDLFMPPQKPDFIPC